MRSKSFQAAILVAILTPAFAGAAGFKKELLLDKDHVAPIEALKEALALLPPATAKSLVCKNELDLFQAVAEGRGEKLSLYNVLFTIAGVTTEQDALKYRAKLNKIVREARKVIVDEDSDELKAAKLNRFLHDKPLHGGYVVNQNDFLKLLDDGTYNCVSSAMLFNVVGKNLKLKTRAVTIPGHIFLCTGDVCIEPTSGETFETVAHKVLVEDKTLAKNDFFKHVYADASKCESGNSGLLGQVYYNNSNLISGDKHYDQSAILALKALCLAPKHPLFTYWNKIALENWFNDTLKQKDLAKAQDIADVYGKLYGNDSNKLFKQVSAARKGKVLAKS